MSTRRENKEENDDMKAVAQWILDPTDDGPSEKVTDYIRKLLDEDDANKTLQKRQDNQS